MRGIIAGIDSCKVNGGVFYLFDAIETTRPVENLVNFDATRRATIAMIVRFWAGFKDDLC